MKHSDITYIDVPRETFIKTDRLIEQYRTQFKLYLDQLLWWNKRVNLVSRNVSRETIWQHIRHSLLLSQFKVYKNSKVILDSGTGGGLPGLPLALISPEKNFILNDVVSKKILAIKQMAQALGLENITTADRSVEEIPIDDAFLLISKHAFKIDDLYSMVSEKKWSQMIFYKGLSFEKELSRLPPSQTIEAYNLSAGTEDPFYNDKALVIVKR